MKKIFLSALVAAAAAFNAVAADTINYSAVVRGADNQAVANAQIGLKFTFIKGTVPVFTEEGVAYTNAAGVLNYAIGTNESLADINWSEDLKLNVAVDVNGGTEYAYLSSSDLAAVPYALQSSYDEGQNIMIDELDGRTYRLRQDLNTAIGKHGDLEAQVADQANVIENLVNEAIELEAFKADQENRNENYENAFNEQNAVNADVANVLENLVNAATENEAFKADQENRNENYENAFNELTIAVDANTEAIALQQHVNAQQIEFNQEVSQFYADQEEYNNELRETVKAVDEIQMETLPQITNDIERLEARIDAIPGIEDLEGVQQLAEIVEQHEGELAQLKANVNFMLPVVDSMTDFVENQEVVNGKVTAMEGTVNYLDGKVEENSNAIALINRQLVANEEARQEMAEFVITQEGYNEEVAASIATLDEVVGEKLPEIVNDIQRINETVEGQTAEIDELFGQQGRLQAQLNTNIGNVGNMAIEIEDLQGASERQLRDFNTLVGTVADHYTEIEDLQGAMLRAQNNINTVIDTANTNKEAIEGINTDLNNLGENYMNLGNEVEAVKGDLENLGENYTMMGQELETVKGDLENLGENYTHLGQQVEAINGDIENLGENYTNMGTELETVKGDLENLGENYTNMGYELKAFKADQENMNENYQNALNEFQIAVSANTEAIGLQQHTNAQQIEFNQSVTDFFTQYEEDMNEIAPALQTLEEIQGETLPQMDVTMQTMQNQIDTLEAENATLKAALNKLINFINVQHGTNMEEVQ